MTQKEIQEIKELLADESNKWKLDVGDWMGYAEDQLCEVERLQKDIAMLTDTTTKTDKAY